jgi:hypothetical protein
MNIFSKPNKGENHTIFQRLIILEMLMLAIVSISCLMGSRLVIIDLGLIGVYYEYKNKSMWFIEPIIFIGFCVGHVTL